MSRSMSMSMSVLMSLLLVSFRYYMAVWMVHMSTSMQHVHVDASCPCWMSMLHVYGARLRCMSMLYVNSDSACSCWLSMRHGEQTACRYRGNDRNASAYIYIWPVHKLTHIPYRKQGLAVFRVPLPNTLLVFKIIFFYFLRIIFKIHTCIRLCTWFVMLSLKVVM